MEWSVVKTGVEMFDMLHAYGLCLTLAGASGGPVVLWDDVCLYRLRSAAVPRGSADLLDDLFHLPDVTELQRGTILPATLPVANLDGLLAALFTQGKRVCSVADVLHKQRFDTSGGVQGIAKARKACADWKDSTTRAATRPSHWIDELLEDYAPAHPSIPAPSTARGKTDITAPMTLDPSLGYGPRRQRSDGSIATKANMTFRGTRFAVLFAYIGAMRFLRAQPVTANLVNYYVPMASTLTLYARTALPPLPRAIDQTPDRALLVQWLGYATNSPVRGACWKSLAFQTLQTQGTQQSISLRRGCLDLEWLERLKAEVGRHVLTFWKVLLSQTSDTFSYETDDLVEALSSRHLDSWLAHLLEVARAVQINKDQVIRTYSVQEVKEVTTYMQSSTSTPLSAVLERREGTLRFGHALRQLRRFNAAAARDMIEELETVQTRDQFLTVLGHLTQECDVTVAKWEFMGVPDDADLKLLLADVDQYSAQTIARLLILLSALQYPRATAPNQAMNETAQEDDTDGHAPHERKAP